MQIAKSTSPLSYSQHDFHQRLSTKPESVWETPPVVSALFSSVWKGLRLDFSLRSSILQHVKFSPLSSPANIRSNGCNASPLDILYDEKNQIDYGSDHNQIIFLFSHRNTCLMGKTWTKYIKHYILSFFFKICSF